MKGMTPAVLNWIFVLIAGGVIMLFFFKIIALQGDISEKEAEGRISRQLEEIVFGKASTQDLTSEFFAPEIEYVCEEPCTSQTGCESYFLFQNTQIDLTTQPVFSSDIPEGKVFAFSKGWDVPFHATNFLYLASEKQRILFPSSCEGECERIYSLIPQKLKTAKVVTQGGEGRTIGFGTPCDAEVCFDGNTVTFNDGTYNTFGDESKLGAIFSENGKEFECNMKKAYYKMNYVSQVLRKKMQHFKVFYTDDDLEVFCMPAINPSIIQLNNYNTDYYTNLETEKSQLETNNRLLARWSCATIY